MLSIESSHRAPLAFPHRIGTPSGIYQLPVNIPTAHSFVCNHMPKYLLLEFAAYCCKFGIPVSLCLISTHLFLNPPSKSCIPDIAVKRTKNSTKTITSTKLDRDFRITLTITLTPGKAAIGRSARITLMECSPDKLLIAGNRDNHLHQQLQLNMRQV